MARGRLAVWTVALCGVALLAAHLWSAPHAAAAPYTDRYTEMLRGFRGDLYVTEVNGAALVFMESGPNNLCWGDMPMIRWDGRDAGATCNSLRRVGDDLIRTEEYPRTILSGRFED